MLTRTLCHFPGIGAKTEQALWSAGITSWEAIVQGRTARPFKPAWTQHALESLERFAVRNLAYFYERLPSSCQWRLFQDFQSSCAFLDIETTGLSAFDQITTIALYDGRKLRWYVQGHNLQAFATDVQDYALLVTYNGKCFDLPFLERTLRIKLPHAHIDLRYTLHSLGITGGLKNCERQLGVDRAGLEEVDGFVAVLLWEEYRRHKNVKALQSLLAYNIQDTINLHTLMIHAHNAQVQRTPFAAGHTLPMPSTPANPFQADRDTVRKALRQLYGCRSF